MVVLIFSLLLLIPLNLSKNITAANPYAYFYDLYYILEDFDGDGNNDGATVEFDVDVDTADTVGITVITRLFSISHSLIDENHITYGTYYDNIDYKSLTIGPVATDGWYYIEVVLEQTYYIAEYLYSDDEYLYDAFKEWTVMVYMDGDNNLEGAALKDFNEMEYAGGTTSNVNVVTIFDRCSADYETSYGYTNDWSGTRYYEVRADSDMSTMNSYLVQDLGEQNMGEIATLYYFIDWAMTYYAADHYALIFWDHGGGLDGVCWDEDNGNDNLDLSEIWYALQEYYIDFIGFDACDMGQFEVLYQLKDYCDVFGASMTPEPGDGWDYISSISSLISNPYMSAEQFGSIICEDYIAFYPDTGVTFGVYDINALSDFDTLLNDFSQQLISALPSYKTQIFQARLNTRMLGWLDSCDFYQFIENIASLSYAPLASSASNLLSALDDALIYTDSTQYSNFYGLAIYFPAIDYTTEFQQYLDNDYGMTIIGDTYWDNFLADWRSELSILIPSWDENLDYSGSISSGETEIIQAYLPATPVDDAYIVILNIEYDMEVSLMTWNEERTFYSSSFMPINIPETVGFFCDSATNAYFIVSCHSGSGSFELSFHWIDVTDDSYEDNDIISQSSTLEIDTTYFMMGMDDDYFEINLNAGDTVTAAIEFNLVNDYDLYIYDDSYSEVDYSAGFSHPEVVEFVAEYSGNYYLYVEPFDVSYIPYYTISTRVTPDEAPSIVSTDHTPSSPISGQSITVTCYVTDNMGLNSVTLAYNTSTGWVSLNMNHQGGGIYEGIIPYQEDATSIQYYIIAEDNYAHVTESNYITVIYTPPEPTTESSSTGFILPLLIVAILPIIRKRKKK